MRTVLMGTLANLAEADAGLTFFFLGLATLEGEGWGPGLDGEAILGPAL